MRDGAFQSVMVATDFSARARLALDRAAQLPLQATAEVLLAHVLRSNATEREEEEAGYQLELLASTWTAPVTLRPLVLRGRRHVELIRAARLQGVEVLLFGGQAGERVGKTTLRVVRKADRPILVVRGSVMGPYRGVLAGLALEDVAAEVVELAARMVDAEAESRLVALHVAPIPGYVHGISQESQHHVRDLEHEHATKALGSMLGQAARRWEVRVAHGDPTDLLLRESTGSAVDLIVVGSHARSGLVHHLLGSVAESVLQRAYKDVLIGRPARFAFSLP